MFNKFLWLALRKLPIEGVTIAMNVRRQKKEFCVPTHLTETEALHVADMAGEREWSNSAYIRHLIKKDIERHLYQCDSFEDALNRLRVIHEENLECTYFTIERGEWL